MPDCKDYREVMMAVLDREATEEEETAWEAHIKTCEDCKRLYGEFLLIQKETRNMTAHPPFDLKNRIIQRATEAKQEENIRHLHRRKAVRNSIVGTVAAAAVLIAVFTGGFRLIRENFTGSDAAGKQRLERYGLMTEGNEGYLEDTADGSWESEYVPNEAESEAELGMTMDEENSLYQDHSNGLESKDAGLSREEIMEKVREAFSNMSITGFTREVIYMSAARYPDWVTGEAIPDLPDMRLYTVNDYSDFSEKVADVLTGSYYELTEDEISEIGLHNGGSKILVLIALDS